MLHLKNPKDSGVKTSLGGHECHIPKNSGVKSSFGGHECYIKKSKR